MPGTPATSLLRNSQLGVSRSASKHGVVAGLVEVVRGVAIGREEPTAGASGGSMGAAGPGGAFVQTKCAHGFGDHVSWARWTNQLFTAIGLSRNSRPMLLGADFVQLLHCTRGQQLCSVQDMYKFLGTARRFEPKRSSVQVFWAQ